MSPTTASSRLLLLLLGFLALSISANARPCRTFVISSYSVSFKHPSSDATTLTTFTEIRSFIPENSYARSSQIFFDRANNPLELFEERDDEIDRRRQQRQRVPFGFSSSSSSYYDFNSLRDRTKDILSVVVALLFGVGCGALTAATMYMVWSLFTSNRYDSYDDYYVGDDEQVDSPKKMGYVKIPAVESAPAPPQAKEVV